MARKKYLLVGAVFSAGLIALVAGVLLQQYASSLAISNQHINEIAGYQSKWRPINSDQQVGGDDWKNKTVLLNFWGSWCPPCIEEMPLLDRFNKEYADQGIRVVGIVIDQEDAAMEFLESNQIEFPSVIANMKVTNELMEFLGNDEGVLPFTVVFNESGKKELTHLGPLTEKHLQKLIQ